MKNILTLLAATITTTLMAQTEPTAQFSPIDTAVVHGKLSNGLTYYIRHNEQPQQRADFYIVQRVGAILEDDNQDGLAHFLEHMAFNGTKNFPGKQLINYLEGVGVKFGENINAYTSTDQTVYNLSDVPTNNPNVVDSALLILHDWSGFISLLDDEIDSERGVIREEWRTRNTGNRRMYFETIRNTMPGTQYAKRDIIGDTAVINNFKYNELRAYYHKWYRPDLQAIVIVGNIDPQAIEQRIKTMWADIPAPAADAAERIYYPLPNNDAPIVSVVTDIEARFSTFEIAFRFNPTPDSIKLTQIDNEITDGILRHLTSIVISNRFADLVQQGNSPIVHGASYFSSTTPTKDELSFMVVAAQNKTAEAYTLLTDEVEKVRRFGFTQAEVDRAKTQLLSEIKDAYSERFTTDNRAYVNECIRHFLSAEPMPGIEHECNLYNSFVPTVTHNYLFDYIKPYMRNNIVISYTGSNQEGAFIPKQADLLAQFNAAGQRQLAQYKEETFNGPLVDKTPKAGKVKRILPTDLPDVQKWILSNGIEVIIAPTNNKGNEIQMQIIGKGGISKLSADYLASAIATPTIAEYSGLGKYSSTELSKMLSGKSVSVSPSIGRSYEYIDGTSNINDFETMLQLTYLYFTQPRIDSVGYNTTIDYFSAVLANSANDPNKAFSDSIRATSAHGNPYANNSMNMSRIKEIDLQKAIAIYKQRFANPADFKFIFVGNIDPKRDKKAITTWIGGLKTSADRETYTDRDAYMPKGHVTNNFKRKLNVNKTSSFTAYSGTAEPTVKNAIVFDALAAILDMRYLESIREKEGGSYGVSTWASFSIVPTAQYKLCMAFDTDPLKFDHLKQILHSEIATIAQNGPLATDLAKVISNMHKQYAENIKNNSWLIEAIFDKEINNFDRINNASQIIDSIDAATIKAAAQKVIDDNNIVEVTMQPEQ